MKERILCRSIELFGRYGVKGLTMAGIASELSISKRTLYEYFGCKEELLSECLCLHLKNCKLFTPTAGGLIDDLLALYAGIRKINLPNAHRFCRELQKFYNPVYRMLLSQLSNYTSACHEKVRTGIDNGYIRRDVTASVVCRAVSGYLTCHFSGTESEAANIRKVLSPEMIVLFTRGLCTIKGCDYLDKKLKEFAL